MCLAMHNQKLILVLSNMISHRHTHYLPDYLPEMECISTYSRHCEQQKLGMQPVTGFLTQLATLKLVVST